ncbi:MAG: hypothetical protein VYD81_03990 [Planctomycetota bacterium]|nr:hypothetical protein [Planctomycetota bacterium]
MQQEVAREFFFRGDVEGAQRYLPLYLITSPFESEFHLYPGQYGGTIQPTETVGFSPGNKILLEQVFLG